MSLAKIFSLYTICFLGVTILIGIAEQLFGLPPRWIGWIFMGLSLGIYIVIGIITRTSNPDQYYVAGRGVPAVFNGMATGSDWMSAASFISMAGALSAQGFVGLIGVLFCSVLGGMKSVTWTQVAQYIILIVSYLVPVVYLSYQLFAIPIPELTYGRLLQTNNTKAIEITRDAKEKETRALWQKEAAAANAKIKMGNLNDDEADKLRAAAKTATQQATAPAASDDAKIGRYLTVPTGVGMWNFLALTFCLMVGTAGLPHILTRYYTTPSVRQARTSVAWSLFFIFLLYFTAPSYAAFARNAVFSHLVGTPVNQLPRWITLWEPAGLFSVVDKLQDGIVQ